MSLTWTLLGTLAELALAGFLFMLVVFSAGGLANGAALGRFALGVLNLSMFLLPALCVLSAGIVIWLHLHGAGSAAYAWYALPLAATALYLACVVMLGRAA